MHRISKSQIYLYPALVRLSVNIKGANMIEKKENPAINNEVEEIELEVGLNNFLFELDQDMWAKYFKDYNLREFPFSIEKHQPIKLPLKNIFNIPAFKKLFLDILKDDDWDKCTDICMSDLSINKNYVLSKLKVISDEETDYKAQLNILVYYAISTRFYIEKIKNKISIPSTKCDSFEDAVADFEKLKKTPGNKLSFESTPGGKASNYFMEELRFKCAKDAQPSFFDHWNETRLIGKMTTYLKGNKRINRSCFAQIRSDTSVSQFKPAAVKYMSYYVHKEDSKVNVSSYLNLCGGWGDRLVGALATPSITRYIETDPNTSLRPVSEQIYKAYDPKKKTEVILYDKPMEELVIDELCPKGKKNDLVFFSPPFFNKEKYEGKEQSHIRYKKAQEWINKFLYKSLQVSYEALNEGGILAINLADIKTSSGAFIKLTDSLVYLLDTTMSAYYTKFSEPHLYKPRMCSNTSSIFIYQTKPYSEGLRSFPEFQFNSDWVITGTKPSQIKAASTSRPKRKKKVMPITHKEPETVAVKNLIQTPTVELPKRFNVNALSLVALHRLIESSVTIEMLAAYLNCSVIDVITRIADWDLRLSYNKLKYEYRSVECFDFVWYEHLSQINGVIHFDSKPIEINKIYCNRVNNELVKALLINPYGKPVVIDISVNELQEKGIKFVFDLFVKSGLCKNWVAFSDYYSIKQPQRIGNMRVLPLSLRELHEIVRSESNDIYIAARLSCSLDELYSKFSMMNISLEQFKMFNSVQAQDFLQGKFDLSVGQVIAMEIQKRASSHPSLFFNVNQQTIVPQGEKRKREDDDDMECSDKRARSVIN